MNESLYTAEDIRNLQEKYIAPAKAQVSRRNFLKGLGAAAPMAAAKPTYFFAPIGGWKSDAIVNPAEQMFDKLRVIYPADGRGFRYKFIQLVEVSGNLTFEWVVE